MRAALLALLVGCAGPEDTGAVATGPGDPPVVKAPAPTLRRLTRAQYDNSVRDLLGDAVVLPTSLEPDQEEDGLLSVGAATASLSALGVDRYESAAYLLAAQVVADPDLYVDVVPCDAASDDDAGCAEELVRTFGRRAWRRPLSDDEVARLSGLITGVGAEAGDFDEGVVYGLAAMLQSPYFVYRREHGEDDGSGQRRLTDWELATRLSFLLWNTTPDDALLDAVEEGRLATDDGLREEAARLLADDRAREGVRNLFTEVFSLYDLDDAVKDPLIFNNASDDLGASAREETLLVIEDLVFDRDADFREIVSTPRTFVDTRLAALYHVPAPDPDGFGEVWLDPDGGRRGLLGHASVLMLYAHSTRSSATLRGKFIRKTLLCQTIPPPPSDVDTSIPEADATSPTLRDRIAVHLEEPVCAGCHELMDPIGLGLENFDGVGQWRDTENGAVIDATGDLDGAAFVSPWQLAGTLRAHEGLGPCFAAHVYRYATGHSIEDDQEPLVDWLGEDFAAQGYSFQALLLDVIASPAFRAAGELQ